jgi:hypothetical protein
VLEGSGLALEELCDSGHRDRLPHRPGFGFLLMAFAIYQLFFGYLISAVWYFLIGTLLRGASQMS